MLQGGRDPCQPRISRWLLYSRAFKGGTTPLNFPKYKKDPRVKIKLTSIPMLIKVEDLPPALPNGRPLSHPLKHYLSSVQIHISLKLPASPRQQIFLRASEHTFVGMQIMHRYCYIDYSSLAYPTRASWPQTLIHQIDDSRVKVSLTPLNADRW